MTNYLEQNKIGTINGIKVQCLPVDCSLLAACARCAFRIYEDCVPCLPHQRTDKAEVYFKKVE